MSRFHVGQRVVVLDDPLVRSRNPQLIGLVFTVATNLIEHRQIPGRYVHDMEEAWPDGNPYCFAPHEIKPIEDSTPNWLEIATGRVKDSAVSQELGWKGKVSV